MNKQLKVLEVGSSVSTGYAAKLLADHGCDVIKVEPPAGDAIRYRGPFREGFNDLECGGLYLGLNVNKRSICIDLESKQGSEQLALLVSWADILIHNYSNEKSLAIGLDSETVALKHPELVVLSITPFGQLGPYKDYQGCDLTVANAGGWATVCPGTHTEEDFPPLKAHGQSCLIMTGISGAVTALAVSRNSKLSGVGEYIDLSEQAYVASILEASIPYFSYAEGIARRYGQRSLIPWGIFQTKDEPIFLVCIEQDQWERLVKFMGNPDWAILEIFADQPGRMENQDIIHNFIQEFFSQWSAQELFHEAQKYRICVAPIMSYQQLADNEHLQNRGFFTSVEHSQLGTVQYMASPIVGLNGRSGIYRPAPTLGEHSEEILKEIAASTSDSIDSKISLSRVKRPLEGIRIIDLTWVWAGTFCSMNLAHLGAEVIRLESESRPDFYRRAGPFPVDEEPGLNKSGHFNQWNQGKKSVAVDLSSPKGIALVKEFIASSDIVVQNFATGVMERLGLGYDELKKINPGIILASISGFGQTGPYREYMAYGPGAAALSGLSAATGYVDGGPEELGISLADPTVGITAAFAIVSALQKKDQSGEGDHIDCTLWESVSALGMEAWMQYSVTASEPKRIGNRDPVMAPHGCFPCRGENEWISIAIANDIQWNELSKIIDVALLDDPRFNSLAKRRENENELEKIVGEWSASRDRWEITEQLQNLGIAAFPSLTTEDIIKDKHLNERGFIERLPHPEVGARAHTGIPWLFKIRANGVQTPSPCLGQDTDEMLRKVLAYDDVKIRSLRAQNILR